MHILISVIIFSTGCISSLVLPGK